MKKIIIATRGSALALWQANHVKSLLEKNNPKLEIFLKVIKTKGDIILDVPLAKVGGKGLFVKEIEEALLDESADLAVHSMKDVPMDLPDGLALGAILEREEKWDLFLSYNFPSLKALPQAAKLGTSSLRRQAQVLALRPDLQIEMLRGNVDTRLSKLKNGQYDAIILAAAGMKRLGLSAPYSEILQAPDFLPSVAQGAIGIEYKRSRTDIFEEIAFLDHLETRMCVSAERAFLRKLDGGCQVPIAAYTTLEDKLSLIALVASVDGKKIIKAEQSADLTADPKLLGEAVANSLLAQGANVILQELIS